MQQTVPACRGAELFDFSRRWACACSTAEEFLHVHQWPAAKFHGEGALRRVDRALVITEQGSFIHPPERQR